MTENGVNSQKDRDSLNYLPKIEYQLPRINATEYDIPTDRIMSSDALIAPVMGPIWTRTVGVVNALKKIEDRLNGKLEHDRVPVSEDMKQTVANAVSKFNHESNGYIPFPLYKDVLVTPDSYEKTVIIDTYENYHTDINGNINAELYTDVVEMLMDWETLLDFIRKGLFAQIVSIGDLPTTYDKNDPAMKKIDEEEKKLIEQMLQAKKDYADKLQDTKAAYLLDPDGQPFFDAKYQSTVKERELKRLEKRVFSKMEIYSLVDSKVSMANVLTSLINNTIDFKPLEGSTMDVLHNLLKQYPSRQSMENGLRKIQAILKLSVDGKTEDVTNVKNDLRGIVSQTHKDRMNLALQNAVHLRNNVLGEVHEMMDYFDGIPDENSVFNVVAEHIVDGIAYADKLYEEQSLDFYKIHTLDGELRNQKLRNVIDKHSPREIYKLMNMVIDYATEIGTWPEQKDLSKWITDFTKAKK